MNSRFKKLSLIEFFEFATNHLCHANTFFLVAKDAKLRSNIKLFYDNHKMGTHDIKL